VRRCAGAFCGNWNCRRQGWQVGWRYLGGRARHFERCGLAGVAQRRHSVAPASLVVRHHRPALEIATGVIRGKTTQTKKRVDFQALLSEIIEDQPPDRQIHVILDNDCTHKKNETWLAAHPKVTFHFTPTSASGLNQVEIWFGIFTRKALSGASFRSAEQLTQAIQDFTAAYNERAAPFVWRKREVKGSQLRHTIVNLRN
jgi:transposase